jgi:hypothetical protein
MSAFMVSHDHIDALMTHARMAQMDFYFMGKRNVDAARFLTDIGRILLKENERSICARYPDCVDQPENMPGKIDERADAYKFKTFEPFVHMPQAKRIAWVLKACACFDYQACETDDYEQSVAHRIIRAIELNAINALPHYESAPWEINREEVIESA